MTTITNTMRKNLTWTKVSACCTYLLLRKKLLFVLLLSSPLLLLLSLSLLPLVSEFASPSAKILDLVLYSIVSCEL